VDERRVRLGRRVEFDAVGAEEGRERRHTDTGRSIVVGFVVACEPLHNSFASIHFRPFVADAW